MVHLAGAAIADRRWTAAYKEEIRASRVRGTRALVGALAAAGRAARRSAVRLGHRLVRGHRRAGGGRVLPGRVRLPARRGQGLGGRGAPGREAGIRVVTLRSGVVISRRGGVLARLLPPFRLGLGARLGSGHAR